MTSFALDRPQTLGEEIANALSHGLGCLLAAASFPILVAHSAHHGGAANGAMSFFVVVPEEELVVALQGNLLFQPFGPFAGAVWAVADAFLAEQP